MFMLFISASLLFPQSLVELAKKEKERRATLRSKGKKGIVVTNVDLENLIGEPNVFVKDLNSSLKSSTRPRQTTTPSPSVEETLQQEERQQDQRDDILRNIPYASRVLPSTLLVENPGFALNEPDGRFAEISIWGFLDLEISAKNGPGADIAVYARLAGAHEVMSRSKEGEIPLDLRGWPQGFWYGVLVMKESGDWEVIGQGTGGSSPGRFDLGSLPSIEKIRIMFKPRSNPTLGAKSNRLQSREFTFGIDAVEVLH